MAVNTDFFTGGIDYTGQGSSSGGSSSSGSGGFFGDLIGSFGSGSGNVLGDLLGNLLSGGSYSSDVNAIEQQMSLLDSFIQDASTIFETNPSDALNRMDSEINFALSLYEYLRQNHARHKNTKAAYDKMIAHSKSKLSLFNQFKSQLKSKGYIINETIQTSSTNLHTLYNEGIKRSWNYKTYEVTVPKNIKTISTSNNVFSSSKDVSKNMFQWLFLVVPVALFTIWKLIKKFRK